MFNNMIVLLGCSGISTKTPNTTFYNLMLLCYPTRRSAFK